jgi:hypothetical protein
VKLTVPVGTAPACVATETVNVTGCVSAIVLDESPSVITGVVLAVGFTVTDPVFEIAAL